jgi:hypothetical protein
VDDLRQTKDILWAAYQEIDDQFSDDDVLNNRLAEAQAKTIEVMELLESIEPSTPLAVGV